MDAGAGVDGKKEGDGEGREGRSKAMGSKGKRARDGKTGTHTWGATWEGCS